MTYTHEDMDTLGLKLAALELTPGEREVLRSMAAAAAQVAEGAGDGTEVAGFAGAGPVPIPESLVDIEAWRRLSSMIASPDEGPDGDGPA